MFIGIDYDEILSELKKLAREAQQFPSASEVAQSEGGASKATNDFRDAVSRTANYMGVATQRAIDSLNATHEAIRQAVEQIVEQDAAIADDAKTIIALLDSAVEQGSSEGDGSTKTEYK